ncbi:MAG: hypothetical protein D8M59_09370 [Planctomycetes bacterium]|nr:hypothetical protein [Planctomycetota bacterium]NOG54272.1 hypothetical protein [Planctomycetota bacterium]
MSEQTDNGVPVRSRMRTGPWVVMWLCIVVAGSVGAVALIVFVQTLSVYNGQPTISVDYGAQLKRMAEERLGLQPGEGDEGWRLFESACSQGWDVKSQYEREIEAQRGEEEYSVRLHLSRIWRGATDTTVERECLRRLEEGGIFNNLEQAMQAGHGVMTYSGECSVYQEQVWWVSTSRTCHTALLASVHLALEASDVTLADSRLRLLLQMEQWTSNQPHRLAVRIGWLRRARTLLMLQYCTVDGTLTPDTCEQILALIDKYPPLSGFDYYARCERAFIYDVTQRMYSGNDSKNGYLLAWMCERELNEGPVEHSFAAAFNGRYRVANRRELLNKYDEWYALCIGQSQYPPVERVVTHKYYDEFFVASDMRKYFLIQLVDSYCYQCLQYQTQTRFNQDGTRLMLALEIYCGEHGSYPTQLDALVPEILDKLPPDPVHGGSWCYHLVNDDPEGRPYLLYSTGLDQEDNGGTPAPADRRRPREYDVLTNRDLGGYDQIVNVPRPPLDEQ